MAATMSAAEVRGWCRSGFEPLRRALADSIDAGREVGAALSVYVGKEAVVDLWAGHRDAARTRPWDEDTIVNLYSVGKAITAVCALRLAEDGALDLDARVSRYWPEFGQAGKDRVSVRHLLTHQAGLPAVFRELPPGAVLQWEVMTEALAAQEPWWEPGAGHGYHVNTYGFLVGEVIRRVTGKTVGGYLRDEITRPAGVDFFIGFGPELDPRCADVIPALPGPGTAERRARLEGEQATLAGLSRMRAAAYRNPPDLSGQGIVNTRRWRAAEVPSTNGHGGARAIARFYSALATDGELDGVRVLAPATIQAAMAEQVHGQDLVLERPTRFGLGFQLAMPPGRSGRARAPSATSGPGARSGSPIPTRASRSATP